MEADVRIDKVDAVQTRGGNTRYVIRDDQGREYTTFRPDHRDARQRNSRAGARTSSFTRTSATVSRTSISTGSPRAAESSAPLTATDPDESAWSTAVEAAPWVLGSREPEREVPRRSSSRSSSRSSAWSPRTSGTGATATTSATERALGSDAIYGCSEAWLEVPHALGCPGTVRLARAFASVVSPPAFSSRPVGSSSNTSTAPPAANDVRAETVEPPLGSPASCKIRIRRGRSRRRRFPSRSSSLPGMRSQMQPLADHGEDELCRPRPAHRQSGADHGRATRGSAGRWRSRSRARAPTSCARTGRRTRTPRRRSASSKRPAGAA